MTSIECIVDSLFFRHNIRVIHSATLQLIIRYKSLATTSSTNTTGGIIIFWI